MNEIIITTQKELDAIDINFNGKIIITGIIDIINKNYPNALVCIKDNAQISYVSGSAQISDVSGSAQIRNVSGSAQISYVYGSAQISYVYGSAQISYVYGSAQISDVSGSAQIRNVYGSAQIRNVYGSAQIRNVYGSAQISYVYGSATVLFIDEQAKVSTGGKNIISYWNDKQVDLNTSLDTTIVILDRNNSTWDAYKSMYPVKIEGNIAIMYKAVRKVDDKYYSNHDSSFEYKIGKIAKETCNTNNKIDCSYGIHISHKMWALQFGRSWNNIALLEVEVEIDSIIVPENCDGKVRTSEVKVIREILRENWYD